MTEPADAESATAVGSADGEPSIDADSARDDEHLADVEEGAGCTEIWEHLSERRDAGED